MEQKIIHDIVRVNYGLPSLPKIKLITHSDDICGDRSYIFALLRAHKSHP